MTEEHTAENDAPVGLVRVDSWKVVCYECRDEYEDWNGWTIFGDHGHAWESASESDWLMREGLVLCPSCWQKKPYCRDEDEKCLRRDVSEADDGWLYCPDHIEQGMDETTVIPPAEGEA